MCEPTPLIRQFAGVKNISRLPYSAGTTTLQAVKQGGQLEVEPIKDRIYLYQHGSQRYLHIGWSEFLITDVVKDEDGHKWRYFIEARNTGKFWIIRPEGRRLWIPEDHYQKLVELLDDQLARLRYFQYVNGQNPTIPRAEF